jgi:hypothetical protein
MPARAALVSPFALVAVLSMTAGPAPASSDLRSPAAERCGAAGIGHIGPGTVLRLTVRGPSCDRARQLVRGYQSCLESERDGVRRAVNRRTDTGLTAMTSRLPQTAPGRP